MKRNNLTEQHPVSLALVVHNSAPWLRSCLESICAQDFAGLELVVVDVASNKKTRKILDKGLKRFQHVNLITTDSNVGGATAVNMAIRAATGEYLFIMDSDDVLPNGSLHALYSAAEKNGFDVTIGRGLALLANGELQEMRYLPDVLTWFKTLTVTDLRDQPELTMAPYYWGRLYRRSMIIDNDIFLKDGRLFADRYFTLNALKNSRATGVIAARSYYWRRDRSRFTKRMSITQRGSIASTIVDRVASFGEVESLFQDPADATVLQYVRLSNLMRLFIHTRHVASRHLKHVFSEHVLPYARTFTEDEVAECEFLLARHKAQWHLLVNEQWDDLAEFNSRRRPSTVLAIQEKDIHDYGNQFSNIPEKLRTQYRRKLARLNGRLDHKSPSKLLIRGSADVAKGQGCEPLYLLAQTRTDGVEYVPLASHSISNGELKFETREFSESIRRDTRGFDLAYISHGRYLTQKISL